MNYKKFQLGSKNVCDLTKIILEYRLLSYKGGRGSSIRSKLPNTLHFIGVLIKYAYY